MMPIDGAGYGKSHYWEWKARELARELDESCKHLDEILPKVTFKYDSKQDDDFYLRFRVKCPKCRVRFYTTEEMMKKIFMNQYGMNPKIPLDQKEKL